MDDYTNLYEIQQQDSLAEIAAQARISSEDSLLTVFAKSFLTYCENEEYIAAQELICAKGLYYYTIGIVPKEDFSRSKLDHYIGQLDGAYAYGDNRMDSMVNGLYWLDALRLNYHEQLPQVKDYYADMGYGFTGNYSSDNISFEALFGDEEILYPDHKVIYIMDSFSYNQEPLMIEVAKENGEWKIYAIGNLEWTP